MRPTLSPIALLLALALPAAAQTPTLSDPKLLQRTFETVWNTVNSRYYDPTFGGTEWAAVKTRYAPLVAAVNSDVEFRELMDRMLDEIKVSHLNMLDLPSLEKSLARAEVTRGLALRDLDSQVVVTRIVEGSYAAMAGLLPGFIVKAIDGVPVANARTAERTLAGDTSLHRLTVVDAGGVTRDFDIAHQLPLAARLESAPVLTGMRHVLVESRILEGNIGYFHFTNFIAPLEKRFRSVVDSMRGTVGLIVDLRGNSGGETEVGLALAGLLVDKETAIAVTQTRRGKGQRYAAKPQKKAYLGPVVILIDEESASESEELTACLQEAGRVLVVGRTSRGEDMDATFQELPMKSLALLYPAGLPKTPKGVQIEGRGVMPNIDIPLSRADLLRGKDIQLETAISLILEAAN